MADQHGGTPQDAQGVDHSVAMQVQGNLVGLHRRAGAARQVDGGDFVAGGAQPGGDMTPDRRVGEGSVDQDDRRLFCSHGDGG